MDPRMRNNQPVVDQEFMLDKLSSLVSTTDLKGRIQHCNDAFVRASGFERHELLGQPHNLIRHPDMPPAAFEDMWRTIQGGSPWTGMVKNRRKDGRHYWVLANVTPLVVRGAVVGFLSVRTVPERAAVEAAEALYARMRERAGDWQLDEGVARRRGLANALARLRARMGSPAMPLAIAAAAAAGWGGHALGAGAVALLPVAAAVAGLSAWTRSRNARLLRETLAPLTRMAAGDLATPGEAARDGVGRALAQLNVNLRAIVGDANCEIEQMRHATREIADGNSDLSARTESQAANVERPRRRWSRSPAPCARAPPPRRAPPASPRRPARAPATRWPRWTR